MSAYSWVSRLDSSSNLLSAQHLFSKNESTYFQKMKVAQSLWDPMDYTVHGILQARILEWVAFPFSRGSSQLRDRTQASRIAGRFFTSWATRETPDLFKRQAVFIHLLALISSVLTPFWAPGGGGRKNGCHTSKAHILCLWVQLSYPEFPAKSHSISMVLIRSCACPQTNHGGQEDAMSWVA